MALAASLLLGARDAAAQAPLVFPKKPTVPVFALDLDLGGAQAPGGDPRLWFGRIGAGLSFWNGERLIDVTTEWGTWRNDRRTFGLSTRYLSASTGLGATATVVHDVDSEAWGGGVGVSYSLLNLQAIVIDTLPRTTRLTLFVRIPFGLITHELLRARASRAKNPEPPTPAAEAPRPSAAASGRPPGAPP